MEYSSEMVAALSSRFEPTFLGDLARVLLSILHAWKLDDDLDTVALKKMHLSQIHNIPTFANASRTGKGFTSF